MAYQMELSSVTLSDCHGFFQSRISHNQQVSRDKFCNLLNGTTFNDLE